MTDDRLVAAQTALAMWNNGRGQADNAWVLRRAFELAQALRDALHALEAARDHRPTEQGPKL